MIKSTQLVHNYQWMGHICDQLSHPDLKWQSISNKLPNPHTQSKDNKQRTCFHYFGGIQIPPTIRPCRGPVRGGEEAHECHTIKAFWMNLAEHRFYRFISLFYAPANKANGAKEICKYESNWPVRTTVLQSNGWQWRGEHKQIGFSCHPYRFH